MLGQSIIKSYIKLECSLVKISKTQIDRLGDRLRKGNITDEDLRLLDEYRRSFSGAYETVVGTIRDRLGLEPTGRPAKSTTSITEKLRRESIRLTQIQDIAGCRLVISDIAEQESVQASLLRIFSTSTVIDRRENPSHGYRAIHVIVAIEGRTIEIQVRTALQQLWAEISEKLADLIDPGIKYGGGEDDTRDLLIEAYITIAEHENVESGVLRMQRDLDHLLLMNNLTHARRVAIMRFKLEFDSHKARIAVAREDALNVFKKWARKLEV
jgi:hypothetical protein